MSTTAVDHSNVISEISPRDAMYLADPKHYWHWGAEAMRAIDLSLRLAGRDVVKSILDLPSGHGRVLRYLRAAYPEAKIVACDIDRDGVDFCAQTFDAIPVYSSANPVDIQLPDGLDLIWCGSLFTHFPHERWLPLIEVCARQLSVGGVFVLTTHGRVFSKLLRAESIDLGLPKASITRLLADFDRFGFGYQAYSNSADYGISLSTPSWVCAELERISTVRIVGFTERGWGGFQDTLTCLRTE
jgi:SAM-dependent methyltransferase